MKNWFIPMLLLIVSISFGQSAENAKKKLDKAINLMDNGSPDEAIMLLDEARKEDPGNYIYDYEKGYAYYIKQDYPTSLKVYKKVVKYANATDQCYQMLGNLYDMTGAPEKALKAYDQGLKKFPNSGRLFVEKGNVFWGQQKYNEALFYYEEGIKADPMYPSNYYRASLIYLSSSEPVWGMIYGETFMNLENNTKRTSEISKLLFDTYKKHITISGDTVRVSFSTNNVINISDMKDLKNFKLPFGTGSYEPTMLLSVVNEKTIDINSLDRIRNNFVDNFYSQEFNKKFPVELFSYQKKVLDAGHLEAYNHWILMKGDEENFLKWQKDNNEKWENFLIWFNENELFLDDNNKFYRAKMN
jgi:hypothetical protein